MALSVHKALRRSGRPAWGIGRRASGMDRSPWLKTARRKTKNARITMWTGARTLVIGIRYPGGHPKDNRISVRKNRLDVTSTVRTHVLRQSIVLPCPAEPHPVLVVEDGSEAIYILLRKKRGTA